MSEALLRHVFESVPSAVGFATSESPSGTLVYIVLGDETREDEATRAFLFARRQLGDYTLRAISVTPAEADRLNLSDRARYFPLR